ncbi:hypothetical protein F5984_09640 [Rudanella paleaurantiibacter]|uniref:Uncharacterized protein n=1 Tax=Rudanella paleaurantiibacter TaxID=2614655 RepID=A0A7J5U070_9BACT|nr:hypothetical protein [Rudanella paleaurantiibacter]KAB7731069.1 hypothetical protein F5984_09640 [Rudanella paleaurantiibacter]
MDQPRDSLAKYMGQTAEKYPTFSNVTLGYRLKKKNDVFPQILVFKDNVQVDHIIGLQKGMLRKLKNRILTDG